jgi:hypothetical protein
MKKLLLTLLTRIIHKLGVQSLCVSCNEFCNIPMRFNNNLDQCQLCDDCYQSYKEMYEDDRCPHCGECHSCKCHNFYDYDPDPLDDIDIRD